MIVSSYRRGQSAGGALQNCVKISTRTGVGTKEIRIWTIKIYARNEKQQQQQESAYRRRRGRKESSKRCKIMSITATKGNNKLTTSITKSRGASVDTQNTHQCTDRSD